MRNNLIFSLDPSSTRSGFCVMDQDEKIREAGIISYKQRAVSEIRIAAMAADLMVLLAQWQPGTVIIEITSGKVNKSRHKGGGQGLATLGMAIGRLWGAAEAWKSTLPIGERNRVRIILVRDSRWICGRTKQVRQDAVSLACQKYDADRDRGADVSDSISMAWWFIREQKIRAAQK